MTNRRLTKRIVDGAGPKPKRYTIWDDEIRGFGVRVEATGTKTYLIRYRPTGLGRAAPKRFITIGRHGPLSPEQARVRARCLLGVVATGGDPAAEVARSKAARTFAEVAQIFLEQHMRAKRKPRSAEDYASILRRHALPILGRLKAERIARADLSKIHLSLRDHAPRANRLLSVISSLYSFAGKHGYVPEGYNPARHIERFREYPRERYLSAGELARLGSTLVEAETAGIPWQVSDGVVSKHLPQPENRRTVVDASAVAAIRLLIFTGARLREVLLLQWQHVDLERGLAFLPDSKTGRRPLFLSEAAQDVLRSLPIAGRFVIAGRKEDEPRADLKRPWEVIRRRARLDGVRLHDLRHTFASVGAGAQLGLPIVGGLLGHKQPQTTARYAHLDSFPLRRAADLIGRQLALSMQIGVSEAELAERRQPAIS